MIETQIYNPGVSFALSSSAGSGKTFALTTRLIAMLLGDVKPSEILVVTFTNLAANDIRRKLFERIFSLRIGNVKEAELFSEILKETAQGIVEKARELTAQLITQFSLFQISTVHSFFARILKCFPRETGLIPDVVIIDEMTKEGLLQEAIERFYSSLKEKDDLLNRVFNFITHYRASSIATAGTVRDVYRAIESKQHTLKGLISIHEGVEKAYDEFISKKNIFISEEITQGIRFLLDILSSYKDTYGGNRAIDSFSRELEFFLKYRNVSSLARLTPFKQEKVRYLEKIRLSVPQETAQRLAHTVSFIQSALTAYFFSQMKYYVFTWLDIYMRINSIYTDIKRARRSVDFTDIEEYALRFLSGLSDFDYFHYRIGSDVKYVLIDEFQDTSEIQWEALSHIVREGLRKGGNFFYVGDEKQSIYRWRGGEPHLFETVRLRLHLLKRSLRFSYRQNPVLLGFVNTIFQNIQNHLWPSYRYEEQKIPPAREGTEQGYFAVVECANRESLLDEIVQQIQNLKTEGIELHDIAVLCRKNSEIEELEKHFMAYHIPCRTEGKSKLLRDYSVMDVVNIMNLAVSPEESIYLGGFLRSPLVRWSYDELHSIQEEEGSISLEKLESCMPELYEHLVSLIHDARFLSPADFIRRCYEELNMLDVYRDKREVLLKLLDLAYTFESTSESASLYDFLRYLNENKDYLTLQLSEEQGVLLLTIHASKGLEFHTVIVPFLTQPFKVRFDGSLLYHKDAHGKITTYSIAKSLYRDYFANIAGMDELNCITDRNYKTDELNALYVALTRAQENLIVIPQKKGGGPSLGEILILSLDPSAQERKNLYRLCSGRPVPSSLGITEKTSRKKIVDLEVSDIWKGEDYLSPVQRVEEGTEVAPSTDLRSQRTGLLTGLVFHRAMDSITHLPIDEVGFDRILRSALAFEGVPYTEAERKQALEAARKSLYYAITDRRIEKFFGYRAWSEALFLSRDQPNFIGRIDRVFVDDGVEVLDFKTNQVWGRPHLEQLISLYRNQVISYCRSLASIYPHRKVKGFLYFTDADYKSRIVPVY